MPAPAPNFLLLKKPRCVSRRVFFKSALAALLATTATYTYSSTWSIHNLIVEQVAVPIPELAVSRHNTRLALLADLHAGPRVSMTYLERALKTTVDLNPDFILIPGDLVDSTLSHLDALCKILAPIANRIPVYASTGNHDFAHRNFPFADAVTAALTNAGVHMLRNNFHQPTPGPGELCFVGLEDLWSDLQDPLTLERTPRDASIILLAHNPDSYEDVAPTRWHLMVSGHTHGGQVCIPGIGPIIVPIKHRERAAGLFHLDPARPQRALYVTRGVGHLLKMRFFCPPEITLITLQDPSMT